MANPMDFATEATFRARLLVRGRSAKYVVNDSVDFDSIDVIPAETVRTNVDGDGFVSSKRMQDFLIHKDDIGGTEPVRGHTIEMDDEVFGLVEMDDEKCFRFHDPPSNTVYRIHTELDTTSKVAG